MIRQIKKAKVRQSRPKLEESSYSKEAEIRQVLGQQRQSEDEEECETEALALDDKPKESIVYQKIESASFDNYTQETTQQGVRF